MTRLIFSSLDGYLVDFISFLSKVRLVVMMIDMT